MPSKYYYVIVHEKTGKLLFMDWKLPIFYKKSAAKTAHANTKGFVIKPILRTELIKFIHDADTPK